MGGTRLDGTGMSIAVDLGLEMEDEDMKEETKEEGGDGKK